MIYSSSLAFEYKGPVTKAKFPSDVVLHWCGQEYTPESYELRIPDVTRVNEEIVDSMFTGEIYFKGVPPRNYILDEDVLILACGTQKIRLVGWHLSSTESEDEDDSRWVIDSGYALAESGV